MRPLVIDDEAREKAKRVMEYAQAHPYYVPSDGAVPGDSPHFRAWLNTYRCVFTFTHVQGKVYRHLSISVPGRNYPNPFAAWTIAELFGFTGWNGKSMEVPAGWLAHMNEEDHAIAIAQEIQA